VWDGVEGLNEGGVALLNVLQGLCLFELSISQPQLDLELGFDQVLPGLALLDSLRYDSSRRPEANSNSRN
jgi:hypothetical protein